MSKSASDPNSRILLTDPYPTILQKLKRAPTDSLPTITYDPLTRPGTSNLLLLLASCRGEDVESIAERYQSAGTGHGELKRDVAAAVEEMLKGPRELFERLRVERGYLGELEKKGAEKARVVSRAPVGEVRKVLGLGA
jgi:tryptophanyl-tRNA synthetase